MERSMGRNTSGFHREPKNGCMWMAEAGERLLIYPVSVWKVGDGSLSLPLKSVLLV